MKKYLILFKKKTKKTKSIQLRSIKKFNLNLHVEDVIFRQTEEEDYIQFQTNRPSVTAYSKIILFDSKNEINLTNSIRLNDMKLILIDYFLNDGLIYDAQNDLTKLYVNKNEYIRIGYGNLVGLFHSKWNITCKFKTNLI